MRTRVREYLGWQEVRDQLKDQQIDPIREQMLADEIRTASKRIPDAIRQAYAIVVTVNESMEQQSILAMPLEGSTSSEMEAAE